VAWLKIVAGALVVLFAVREMFHDLFHPTRRGAISEWVASWLFRVFRRWPRMLPTSGPLSMALVICIWAMLLAIGFALIYWGTFPADYELQTATRPTGSDRWWWSLYYSLEMMTTLGLGDIRPTPTWLKLLSACHTLLGFSLVTASITWIVLVFPALRRMRTLARTAITLSDAQDRTGVPVVSPGMHPVLAGLAEEVIQSRVDLIHFPLLFYFYADDKRASFPLALWPLMRFAKEGAESGRDERVRLTTAGLAIALEALADLLGNRLDCEDRSPEAVFRTFTELHTP
jgi:Ion channel